jgi:hypothetical protein
MVILWVRQGRGAGSIHRGLIFDRRVILQFRGSVITSDAGLLPYPELDNTLGLTDTGGDPLADARTGKNGRRRAPPGHQDASLFRGDAAFANPEIYEFLEGEGIGYAIRLPANRVLQERIGYLLKRPVGRPPLEVRRYYASFTYQAQSWKKSRRVVAKVERHPGELFPSRRLHRNQPGEARRARRRLLQPTRYPSIPLHAAPIAVRAFAMGRPKTKQWRSPVPQSEGNFLLSVNYLTLLNRFLNDAALRRWRGVAPLRPAPERARTVKKA